MSATGAAAPWRAGHRPNKLGHRRIIGIFAVVFLGLAAVVVAIGALSAPPKPKPVCAKGQVCSTPQPPQRLPGAPAPRVPSQRPAQQPGQLAPRLTFDHVFTSSGLGFTVSYPASELTTSQVSPDGVTLAPPISDPAVMIRIEGAPSSQSNPKQLLSQQLASLHQSIPDLHIVNDRSRQILAPAVGGRAGVGGFYQGTFNSPSGLTAPADVAILAASDGLQTLSASVIVANRADTVDDFKWIDEHILATLRFKRDVPQ
jgi:hypothetical protein